MEKPAPDREVRREAGRRGGSKAVGSIVEGHREGSTSLPEMGLHSCGCGESVTVREQKQHAPAGGRGHQG